MTDFKKAAEELDARYEKEVAYVREKYEDDIIIIDGKPHLKIERDGENAFCWFDHRFWYPKEHAEYPRYPWMICVASESYRKKTEGDEDIYERYHTAHTVTR